MQTNGRGWVPIKLYLHQQIVGQIGPGPAFANAGSTHWGLGHTQLKRADQSTQGLKQYPVYCGHELWPLSVVRRDCNPN